MQKVPDINKRNYQKTMRELNLSSYPSFNQNEYLKAVRQKLLKKEKLTYTEEQLSFHRFKRYLEDYKKEVNKYYVKNLDFSPFKHRPLLPFQEDGTKFLLLNERGILADDTGLGKSIETIIAALLLPENYKILIVTLNSLKYNFQHELSFYADSYKIIDKVWDGGYKFTIINYESMKKWKKDILKEKFDCIIADESHVLTNSKSQRSKNFAEIVGGDSIKKVWLLTGTPITNRPINYFNLLKLIKHPLSKNWRTYVEKYCAGFQDNFGIWQVTGHSNEVELYENTKNSILRRLKKDHLPDLPNKERTPIFLKLNNTKGYDKVIEDYNKKQIDNLINENEKSLLKIFDERLDFKEAGMMTRLILWRQFCALEKVKDGSLLELINSKLSESEENKIVVFTNFTSVVDAVQAHFGNEICCFIDGRTKVEDRMKVVERFNNSSDLKIFVCNLQVGGIGLNIQSANIAIVNDMSWVPGIMLQGEDRLWRLGQKRLVNILYPIYADSVEALLYSVVDKKMKVISSIIEGKKEAYFDSNEATEDNKEQVDSVLKEIFDKMKLL